MKDYCIWEQRWTKNFWGHFLIRKKDRKMLYQRFVYKDTNETTNWIRLKDCNKLQTDWDIVETNIISELTEKEAFIEVL